MKLDRVASSISGLISCIHAANASAHCTPAALLLCVDISNLWPIVSLLLPLLACRWAPIASPTTPLQIDLCEAKSCCLIFGFHVFSYVCGRTGSARFSLLFAQLTLRALAGHHWSYSTCGLPLSC